MARAIAFDFCWTSAQLHYDLVSTEDDRFDDWRDVRGDGPKWCELDEAGPHHSYVRQHSELRLEDRKANKEARQQ